jgi:hypothetical protein
MAAAVVATSYLSRFAVRLESSWWLRGPREEGRDEGLKEGRDKRGPGAAESARIA